MMSLSKKIGISFESASMAKRTSLCGCTIGHYVWHKFIFFSALSLNPFNIGPNDCAVTSLRRRFLNFTKAVLLFQVRLDQLHHDHDHRGCEIYMYRCLLNWAKENNFDKQELFQ